MIDTDLKKYLLFILINRSNEELIGYIFEGPECWDVILLAELPIKSALESLDHIGHLEDFILVIFFYIYEEHGVFSREILIVVSSKSQTQGNALERTAAYSDWALIAGITEH